MNLSWLTNYWRRLPLLGRLFDCTPEDRGLAFREVLTVLVFSTVPIWLGTYIVFAGGEKADWASLLAAFLGTISNGELFIYTTALLAPMFWMALSDPPGAGAFPNRWGHMVLIGIVNLFAASSFGLLKAGHTLNTGIAFDASIILYTVAIVLLYLGTVYHNSRLPDPRLQFRDHEDAFVRRYEEHKQ